MTWNAILDWILANWLGLLTLAVVTVGAVVSWLHFRRSKRDVTPRVGFAPDGGALRRQIKVEQSGVEAEPFTVELAVVNLGGSKLKNARLTVTLPGILEAIDSPGWDQDVPNALVGDGSAVAHKLPTMGRNQRYDAPPLTAHHSGLQREGGSYSRTDRLRWEVWSGTEGLGSDDLAIDFTLSPTPR